MLLADTGPDWGYAIYVIILAVIGLFSLVRKFLEKRASGEKGEKIDLGKSVHEKLKKYMDAMEPPRRGAPPPIETVPRRPPTVPAATRLPPPRPEPVRPKTAPEKHVALRDRARPEHTLTRPDLVHLKKPKWELAFEATEAAARAKRPALIKAALTGKQLRKAVLLAEVLGPPVSERKDYRLF